MSNELRNEDAAAKPKRLVGRVTATTVEQLKSLDFSTVEKHMIDSMQHRGYRLVGRVQGEYIFEAEG
jgi:hypothetical protein